MESPEITPKTTRKSVPGFDTLYKSLDKQLDKIPSDQVIPMLPGSDEEAEEIKSFVRDILKLQICDVPPAKVFVGGLILERSDFKAGRIGILNKLPVFAFLYRMENGLRTVCVYPRDGINVRMIAKAIMCGYVSDLPEHVAISDILLRDKFFECCDLDFAKLADAPALGLPQRAFWDRHRQIEKRDEAALAAKSRECERLVERVTALEAENKKLNEASVQESNRAEEWKLGAGVSGSLNVIFIICIALRLF